MKNITVTHYFDDIFCEVHRFGSMTSALHFIDILYSEYNISKIEIIIEPIS